MVASIVGIQDTAPESSSDHQNICDKEHPSKHTVTTPPLNTIHSISMYKGLFLSIFCGVLYSLSGVIVKYTKSLHPGQITLYRFFAVAALSLPPSVKTQQNLLGPKELRFLLLLRGFFGGTNIFLNFLAYRYLPIGEAAVIIYTVPVFVTLAARIFLKEKCGIVQFIIVIITVVGIMFILKVPAVLTGKPFNYTTEYIYGVVAAFSSLIFNTGLFIVLRKLTRVHYSIIMLNFGWVGIIESSILTAIMGDFKLLRCGVEQYLIIVLGIISHFGTVLLTMALQLEQAGPVATMRAASEIIQAFLWQTFFFKENPDGFSIAGAVLLVTSIVLGGLGKWASSLPSHSTAAKCLKFLSA